MANQRRPSRPRRPICESCGSISVVRARGNVIDKVVRLITGRRPVICRRCGWRGRMPWDESFTQAQEKRSSNSNKQDPELAALDQASWANSALKSAAADPVKFTPALDQAISDINAQDLVPVMPEKGRGRTPSSRAPSIT